jgi:hypothetical protein
MSDEFDIKSVKHVPLLKTFVAGEPTPINKKYCDFYEVVSDKLWIFVSNIKPNFIDPNHEDYIEGMDKRFVAIEADEKTFEAAQADSRNSSGVGSSVVSSHVSRATERAKEQNRGVKRLGINFNSEKQKKKDQEDQRLKKKDQEDQRLKIKELEDQVHTIRMKLLYSQAPQKGNCSFILNLNKNYRFNKLILQSLKYYLPDHQQPTSRSVSYQKHNLTTARISTLHLLLRPQTKRLTTTARISTLHLLQPRP